VIVAGLICNIQFLDNGINLLAFEGSLGGIDVPLANLAIDEQSRKGVAATVKSGVKRACNRRNSGVAWGTTRNRQLGPSKP
jgi:hypothetical protein